VSCLAVVFIHFTGWSPFSFGPYLQNDWEFSETAREITRVFWPSLGKPLVLLFFVHSGYLMGKTYFMGRYQLDRPGLTSYFRGRFLRIAPLLWFNLTVCLLLLPSAQPTFMQAFGDFFFINNFTGRNINGPTWSLSWEMQYYLIAPLVFLAFGRVSVSNVVKLLAIGLLFEALAWTIGFDKPGEYYLYFLCGFSVNILLRLTGQTTFRGAPLVAWGGGLFAGMGTCWIVSNMGYVALGQIIAAFSSAFAIYILELPRRDPDAPPAYESYATPHLLWHRFWTWMGIISYGVYLWHWPVMLYFEGAVVEVSGSLVAWLDWTTAYQRMIAYHFVQISLLLPLIIAMSVATFFLVETRFRPNLYRWDNSRFLSRILRWRKRELSVESERVSEPLRPSDTDRTPAG
jgi:peptidoglycan/LPS O-acetylase OafA/YrhL